MKTIITDKINVNPDLMKKWLIFANSYIIQNGIDISNPDDLPDEEFYLEDDGEVYLEINLGKHEIKMHIDKIDYEFSDFSYTYS